MSHGCHAIDCKLEVPPKMLFCRKHWFMVPKKMQDDVWTVYVSGQEVRKDPSYAYLVVQSVAVAYVAHREGTMTYEEGVEHIMSTVRLHYEDCTPNDRDLLRKVGFALDSN